MVPPVEPEFNRLYDDIFAKKKFGIYFDKSEKII